MSRKNEETDEIIADRFKTDYNGQFFILVRMHLSFLLDTQTENNDSLPEKSKIKKWNLVPFVKKSKLRSAMEGAPLTQERIYQIFQLIEYLKIEENIKSEGVFRRTGSIERQQELRCLLNQCFTLDMGNGSYSVHDCASVLKSFLQDLPEPLFTETYFPAYCQLAELYCNNSQISHEQKLLESIQLLLLLLPVENKLLLKDILELLHSTTTFEVHNKMSADNLAKLFTPHLLCPRSLSPTVLLKVSHSLFGIVSFMIRRFPDIFKIPAKLMVDFRAKYEKKRILPPIKHLNESMADVASTVFTFVDQERTAKENESNPTEAALAQLYAHIQSLPESSKKRKLIKQFNKENGCGTPLQTVKNGKNKSIGDSIKKHIFQKHLTRTMKNSSLDSELHSPTGSPSLAMRARLLCHYNCDSSTNLTKESHCSTKKRKTRSCDRLVTKEKYENESKDMFTLPEQNKLEDCKNSNRYLTSTPACFPSKTSDDLFTPEQPDKKSMSPITMSAQRMPRAMQETMMTPRSRKPVLLLSGSNINSLSNTEQPSSTVNGVVEERFDTPTTCEINPPVKSKSEGNLKSQRTETPYRNNSDSDVVLSDTFKEYLSSRDILTICSNQDSSFSSRTDDFNSTELTGQFTESLIYCLDGNDLEDMDVVEEKKKLVLKPKQFDKNGKPIIFETSF